MIKFPTQIPDGDSHSPALLDLFISSDTSSCSTMAFPLMRNSDHVVASWSSGSFERCSMEDILKLSASGAASEFSEWVQVGIDVYIPHRKYKVKPHSSPWFSAACAAPIVHRNNFSYLYQQIKSSESKAKFRQASNRCKRVIEAAKLAYANKTKVHHFPET